MVNIQDLNDRQYEAVTRDGHLLVVAGKGSGKTTIIGERILQLMRASNDGGALVIATTPKDVSAIKKIIHQHSVSRKADPRITTFSQLTEWLLNYQGGRIGISPNFIPLHSHHDQELFMDDVVKDVFGAHHYLRDKCGDIVRIMEWLFSESYDPEYDDISPEWPGWISNLFKEYCNALLKANYQDSGSMLFFCNRLLKEHTFFTKHLNVLWTTICVDEFQNINQAQYNLLRYLAPNKHQSLLLVTDQYPVSQQWNGSSLKHFSALSDDYDLEIIQLPENFRCPPKIVKQASQLFQSKHSNNQVIVDSSNNSFTKLSVDFKIFYDHKEEVEYIAQCITSLGGGGKNCAVIAPTNRLVQATAFELQNLGIHPFVPENENYYESPVLRVILQILWLAHYPSDRTALNRLCHQWYLHTGNIIESQEVVTESVLFRIGFLNAWFNVVHRIEPREHHSTLMLIENHLIERFDFLTLISAFFDSISDIYRGDTHQSFLMNEVMKWKNLHQELIKKFGSRITLSDYITHFSPLSKMESSSPNSLQCITIERAKGLRFEHIFFAGMIQGSIPSYDAIRDGINSQKMDEERRHCFATMTRAQKSLTMTCSMEYFGSSAKPSQFIEEMGLQSITSNDHCSRVNTSTEEAIELPA